VIGVRGFLSVLIVTFVVACSESQTSKQPQVAPAPSDSIDEPPPAQTIVFNLEDADVGELLRVLESITGKSSVVDPNAQALFGCTKITIHGGERLPTAKAVELVVDSLAAHGLVLDTSGDKLHVSRSPSAVSCVK
jgi:type II secretory pathway component GspD/PulD (secretin)